MKKRPLIFSQLLLLLMLIFTATGVVNAKVASGSSTFGLGLSQGESLLEATARLGSSDISTIGVSGSPLVPKGITAKNGVKVDGFARHGVDRAIGNGADRAGVAPKGILDALKNPLKIGDVKTDQLGRQSQRFTGKIGEAVVNPQTNKIISVNPTSTKKAARLMRQLENSQ